MSKCWTLDSFHQTSLILQSEALLTHLGVARRFTRVWVRTHLSGTPRNTPGLTPKLKNPPGTKHKLSWAQNLTKKKSVKSLLSGGRGGEETELKQRILWKFVRVWTISIIFFPFKMFMFKSNLHKRLSTALSLQITVKVSILKKMLKLPRWRDKKSYY